MKAQPTLGARRCRSIRLASKNGTRNAASDIVSDPIPRTENVAPPKPDASNGPKWLAKKTYEVNATNRRRELPISPIPAEVPAGPDEEALAPPSSTLRTEAATTTRAAASTADSRTVTTYEGPPATNSRRSCPLSHIR